jgi:hypothetical protein
VLPEEPPPLDEEPPPDEALPPEEPPPLDDALPPEELPPDDVLPPDALPPSSQSASHPDATDDELDEQPVRARETRASVAALAKRDRYTPGILGAIGSHREERPEV